MTLITTIGIVPRVGDERSNAIVGAGNEQDGRHLGEFEAIGRVVEAQPGFLPD